MGSRPLIPAAAAVLQVSITSVGLWKRLGITSLLDLLKECQCQTICNTPQLPSTLSLTSYPTCTNTLCFVILFYQQLLKDCKSEKLGLPLSCIQKKRLSELFEFLIIFYVLIFFKCGIKNEMQCQENNQLKNTFRNLFFFLSTCQHNNSVDGPHFLSKM